MSAMVSRRTRTPDGIDKDDTVRKIDSAKGFTKVWTACSEPRRDRGTRRTVSRTTAMARLKRDGHTNPTKCSLNSFSSLQNGDSFRCPCHHSAANLTMSFAKTTVFLWLLLAAFFAASPILVAAKATLVVKGLFSTDSSNAARSAQKASSIRLATDDMFNAIWTTSTSRSFSK